MTPAKEVGGDFYDFFKVDNNHIAVIIGDVSGKGIPAAMFMAITKILIQLYIKEGKTLAETFTMVNLFLYTDGVTEAINNKNELFGDERLKRCFDEKSTESIKSTIENIKCKINCFADGLEQFDDITMLALKISEYNKEIDKNDN